MADKLTTSLRDTEQRMKRALELRGSLDLQLLSGVVPVVLVNDATLPGYRSQIERGWSYGETVPQGAGSFSHIALKANSRPIVIERVFWAPPGAAAGFSIGILSPADADPWAIATNAVRFTDRLALSTEVTGILTGIQTADAAEYGNMIFRDISTSTALRDVAVDVVLDIGAKLIVQGLQLNTAMAVSFKGRML